ncbi:histone-lysine N-methyltransferase SETDB2 isoform X1 [Echeneis naucrates]|uniref:histone-lysine N-methyltransferase SETDB2 isoform X1 n=2 Tax=Echeneis naucrates TaxID=173247 RepID=UPI0011134014|nr:histone-lysine N-methyltransferase SETDB2-like isoform X1 [Echeneis naucrates]
MEDSGHVVTDLERAKAFWAEEDVDQVFNKVFQYLNQLKGVLKKNTATDKELVQAWKILETLDLTAWSFSRDSTVVQVVIGSGELLPADPLNLSPCTSPLPSPNGLSSAAEQPTGRELLPPLTPIQLLSQPHICCKACIPGLSSMSQSTPPFWGQNPLKVPWLCGFQRLRTIPLVSVGGEGSRAEEDEGVGPALSEDLDVDNEVDWEVMYKAPCGRSLRDHDDVMDFLLDTESYDILQVDFFSFNPSVQLDPPEAPSLRHPELDLSRGLEPMPVELCVGEGEARPDEFRYRRDRWPHGCFLSRGTTLFDTCCDCTDGCTDAQRCACIAMTTVGHHYTHHRLRQPVPSGLYECGPWCSCDHARCQNRLVQRGIRVRLQVFQTKDRGWGVRCRDDLDCGTFVCIYAGVILQRVHNPFEAPPPKLTRAEQPSDDEVEVVTEWLVPPVLEVRGKLKSPPPTNSSTSPPLHVPVIQRPTDINTALAAAQDRNKGHMLLVGGPGASPPSDSPVLAAVSRVSGSETETKEKKSFKRAVTVEEVHFLDASKEGNVSRFINHSCRPNLFIQNVFIDSHDPGFPVIAFFTNRAVKAGTELTWNYSADSQTACDGCHGNFTIQESLCEVCDVKGQEVTAAD